MFAGPGDDSLNTVDFPTGTDEIPDAIYGDGGDDTLQGDDGDFLSGDEGQDAFIINRVAGGDVAIIEDLAVTDDPATSESITLLNEDGEAFSAAEIAANLTIAATPDGTSALLVYSGEAMVMIENLPPSALTDQANWLGNLA